MTSAASSTSTTAPAPAPSALTYTAPGNILLTQSDAQNMDDTLAPNVLNRN